jgi:hypothetical protein
MTPFDAYSPDFKTARARFRAMVGERGWSSEAHVVSAPGFAEGDLTIDVARAGPAAADRVVVLSSGLHGTEAPFGSAVQLAWIDSLPRNWEPPAECSVLLLHALNPFGFATVRRVNEDNVDLNRNFLAAADFARLKAKTAREFGPLDYYLNPRYRPGRFNWATVIFLKMLLRLGRPILSQVLPAGQYAFPDGIFYGGERPCRSTQIIMSEMPRWLGGAKSVVHLDFHTGLGKFGDFRLLLSDPEGSEREKLAQRLFGPDRVEADAKTAGGYHNHGDMGEWLSKAFADRNYLYLCAEFGTYGSVRVIGALRRENQAHHWESPDTRRFRQIKNEVREIFVPESPAWRCGTVELSLKLIQQSLNSCA